MTHHPQSVDLKRLLHESKDRHNHSLFDHVCNILHHIDHNHGDVTVEDFENISHFLASTKFAYHQYDPAHVVNNPVAVDEHGLKKHYAKISKLISEVHNDPQSWVQDFSEVNCDWNVAGFGFGEEEAKTLHLVLEKLATKNRCDNISFLGIVNGSSKDYFVAYGRLRQHVNDKLPDSWEKSGTGVNAITFWAANESRFKNLHSSWRMGRTSSHRP
jgi:Radial spokehead-like protein